MANPIAILEKISRGEPLTETDVTAIRQEVIRARQELSKAVRSFWASDAGQAVATLLSYQAYTSGYADEVKNVMDRIADDLKRIARATNIGGLYRWVWGKPRRA